MRSLHFTCRFYGKIFELLHTDFLRPSLFNILQRCRDEVPVKKIKKPRLLLDTIGYNHLMTIGRGACAELYRSMGWVQNRIPRSLLQGSLLY